jgi:hypothetical protein
MSHTLLVVNSTIAFISIVANEFTADDVNAAHATPSALALASFDALKRDDFPAVVSLFHPDEFVRFKLYAQKMINFKVPYAELNKIREILAPFDSPKAVAEASGSELLLAFLKNSFKQTPETKEILSEAKMQVLGEIVEKPDIVHVIVRTLIRPQAISCRRQDDKWYQLLDHDLMRVITAFELKAHFEKKKIQPLDIPQKLKMDSLHVVGQVIEDNNTAHVLCRVTMKIDSFSFQSLGCYPVQLGEPAWGHLSSKDKTKLADALRAKWKPPVLSP